MIDFRYHLVSIVAIFLALAIGIVFGSTALRGTLLRALQLEATRLHNEISAKNSANASLSQQAGRQRGVRLRPGPRCCSRTCSTARAWCWSPPRARSSR